MYKIYCRDNILKLLTPKLQNPFYKQLQQKGCYQKTPELFFAASPEYFGRILLKILMDSGVRFEARWPCILVVRARISIYCFVFFENAQSRKIFERAESVGVENHLQHLFFYSIFPKILVHLGFLCFDWDLQE